MFITELPAFTLSSIPYSCNGRTLLAPSFRSSIAQKKSIYKLNAADWTSDQNLLLDTDFGSVESGIYRVVCFMQIDI